MLPLLVALTLGVIALLGSGAGFWLCVPAALLATARARTRPAVLAGCGLVAGSAFGLVLIRHGQLPPTGLALVVPAASVAVLAVVRERLQRECDALRRTALSDPLTGVANRRALLARIEYEVSRHARSRTQFAVVMLDLDGFKGLNDRFGHPAGDDLLRDVARALQRTVRAQDTVARLGGDEFCVLAPETEGEGLGKLESRIVRAVETVTAGVQHLRASVGIATFPADGRSGVGLIHAADQRLLDAKRSRGSRRVERRAA